MNAFWQEIFTTIYAIEVFVLLGVMSTFVVLYFSRSNWKETRAGRALGKMMLAMMVFLSLSILRLVFGDAWIEWDWRPLVLVFMFTPILVFQASLLTALVKAQRKRVARPVTRVRN